MAITSKRRGPAHSYFTKIWRNVCKIIVISFKVKRGLAHSFQADYLEIFTKNRVLSRDKGSKKISRRFSEKAAKTT